MRYTLQEILWDSEFGVNYLATDGNHHTKVVVRKLSSELDHRNEARWKKEWRILQKIRHRGVPNILEMTTYRFENRRFPILVHEYAKGEQLKSMHNRQPLSQQQALMLCGDLLQVTSYLQSVNPAVIHRNISPESVYVLQGSNRVQLWDFGAAMFYSGHQGTVTQDIGELVFSAPEQLLGTPDLSSDVYSIAMTLIWCLAKADQRPTIDWGSVAIRLPSLPISDLLRTWLKKATAPADRRFSTASEAYDAFKGFLPDEPTLDNMFNLKETFSFASAIQDAIKGNPNPLEQLYEGFKKAQSSDPKMAMAAVALQKETASAYIRTEIVSWILSQEGVQRYWLKLQGLRLKAIRMSAEVESLAASEQSMPLWARLTGFKQRQIQEQREQILKHREKTEAQVFELENLLYHRVLPFAECFGIPVHEIIKGI